MILLLENSVLSVVDDGVRQREKQASENTTTVASTLASWRRARNWRLQQVCGGYRRSNLISPGNQSPLKDMTATCPQSNCLTLCSSMKMFIDPLPQTFYMQRKGLPYTCMQVKIKHLSIDHLQKDCIKLAWTIFEDAESVFLPPDEPYQVRKLILMTFWWQSVTTSINNFIQASKDGLRPVILMRNLRSCCWTCYLKTLCLAYCHEKTASEPSQFSRTFIYTTHLFLRRTHTSR